MTETDRSHVMPHGAQWVAHVGTRFRLWAPAHPSIDLVLGDQPPLPMQSIGEGWHELLVRDAEPGTLYRFRLPDGTMVPDPASRFQPHDVHGPSEVIDPREFRWRDGDWPGRPWHEAILYELHVGAFTPEGTFRATIGKLDHLASLGVNAVEVMPVGDFPGARNWGYDGVLPYAPDRAYGRPEDFKAFVEACHMRGLSVILDVVYNHFGPDGNYLSLYAPAFFTERHHTPWGAAVNYDGLSSRAVRDFAIHNALYWIEEYHLDGLRLDAVHAIIDKTTPHLLHELSVRARHATLNRPLHLILENEENATSRLLRSDAGHAQRYTAQWNDDVHHALHAAASGECVSYYADYAGDTDKLGRALAQGFAFQGEMMPFRGRPRGEPSGELPPIAFVSYIQNHDQIGNRAFGDRLNTFATAEAVRAVSAVCLLMPQVPMLFMGEEWGATTPFPFFCDVSSDLAEAVREGRREEFKHVPAFRDAAARDRIPDPSAEATFLSAKLDWDAVDPQALARTRRLLTLRRDRIVPLVAAMGPGAGSYRILGREAVTVTWTTEDGRVLRLDANLKAAPQGGFSESSGAEIWREGEEDGDRLGPWAVRWSVLLRPPDSSVYGPG